MKKVEIHKPNGSALWFIIPDIHFPEHDPEALEIMLAAHRELKPTNTLLLGDVLDCGIFSSHSKKSLIENQAYDYKRLEIDPCNNLLDQLQKNTKNYTYYLEGNHESVEQETEVLTEEGWIKAKDITKDTIIGSFSLQTKEISFNKIINLSSHYAPLYSVKGDLHDEVISDRHKVVIDNKLVPVTQVESKINQKRFTYAAKKKTNGVGIDEDILRILTWIIMDSTIVLGPGIKTRVQWKLSKPRKLERIQTLLCKAGIKFTYRPATKSPSNKLQPYYICVYGEDARNLVSLLPEGKKIPKNWENLNKTELDSVLEEIQHTDGEINPTNGIRYLRWTSTEKDNVERIQLACIYNNIPCSYKTKCNGSGFPNAKLQYIVSIYKNGLSNRRYNKIINLNILGKVISIQTKDGTLITRRNGKIAFTGNSRIERWAVNNGHLGESIYDFISPKATLAKGRKNFTMIPYSPPSGDRRGFVQIVPNVQKMKTGALVAVHGWSFAKNAAAVHLEASRTQSIVYGHCHRIESKASRDPWTGKIIKAFCPGTLSKLQPIYMVGGAPSSWCHGFAIVYVGTTSWTEYMISIVNGRCVLPTGKELRIV